MRSRMKIKSASQCKLQLLKLSMLLGSIIIIDQRTRDSKELQCQLQIECWVGEPKAGG